MEISNKDIWREEKKYCIICEKENNNGIEVMNNFICERCVKRINLLDIDSDEYEFIKNKFKNTIVSKISNFKYK